MSETATMTLTEFLLARIAEDEAAARRIHAERCDTPAEVVPDSMGRPMDPVCDCDWHVARVLAECEAKRRIVEFHTPFINHPNNVLALMAEVTLVSLAASYADHPDYREEWKP